MNYLILLIYTESRLFLLITFVGSLENVVGFVANNLNDGVVCSCLVKDFNYSVNMSVGKNQVVDSDTIVYINEVGNNGVLISAEIFQCK